MLFNMKPEPKKKLPNKKVISSAKFEAKEQFTKSALENLKTENERLVNCLLYTSPSPRDVRSSRMPSSA